MRPGARGFLREDKRLQYSDFDAAMELFNPGVKQALPTSSKLLHMQPFRRAVRQKRIKGLSLSQC